MDEGVSEEEDEEGTIQGIAVVVVVECDVNYFRLYTCLRRFYYERIKLIVFRSYPIKATWL